ncbi:RVT_3 domain-containing protein, partial [Cephalotus follicularis]
PENSGYGGIFRDNLGNWLFRFAGYIGFSTILEAELWSIRAGLRLAIQHGFTMLVIETDSLNVVQLLQMTYTSFHPLEGLLAYRRGLLRQLHKFSIRHTERGQLLC